jgi:acetyl-CoA carboxylase biotin carboxyl carrier protein
MDIKDINLLIEAISKSPLTYFEVEKEGIHLTMKKEAIYQVAPQVSYMENIAPNINVEKPIEKPVEKAVENGVLITSPIVGTVYLTPSPTQPNFVQVGSIVNKGDVLCIIEAMKLMNEIEADFSGKVIEVLVENEQMVEFGQPIYRIAPLA